MPQALPAGAISTGFIKEFARAKINLTLTIAGRRADGFHELISLVAFADIGDRLSIAIGEPPSVRVSGPFGEAVLGRNIVEVALERLAAVMPELRIGSVKLEKRLPIAAGIGGGSADAAALLRLVRRANAGPEGEAVDWQRVAASLGSDVPVCLLSRAAWMTGVGDVIAPLQGPLPEVAVVLVNTLAPVRADKTAAVFARYRALAGELKPCGRLPVPDVSFANPAGLIDYMRARGNDLQAAAIELAPEIDTVLNALRAAPGCRHAALSGAGPTCFGIFADAVGAAEGIRAAHPDWWVEPARLS